MCHNGWLQALQQGQAGQGDAVSLWVRIKGKANKVNGIVGVYCRTLNQDDDTNESLFKEQRNTSITLTLVLTGDSNLADVNWE